MANLQRDEPRDNAHESALWMPLVLKDFHQALERQGPYPNASWHLTFLMQNMRSKILLTRKSRSTREKRCLWQLKNGKHYTRLKPFSTEKWTSIRLKFQAIARQGHGVVILFVKIHPLHKHVAFNL